MRLALTGNPNSGKTTMYNALTGRNEKIGNWAGVTVDKKEYKVKREYYDGEEELTAVDLPGAYSMSPFSSEESITSAYVKNEGPDVIINIVDASNLSRSLFFTTQLLELGIQLVIALNKSDINDKKGNKVDEVLLSEILGCPVIRTVSTSEKGIKELVQAAVEIAGKGQKAVYVQGKVNLNDKNDVEKADRKRYEFVKSVVDRVEHKKTISKVKNRQDKLDDNLTHPVLGLMVFAVIMFGVFYISQAESPIGKSVIPMIIGTGCSVPAVMSCRTIRNERERRATAVLATFMPCGAKLPVIALFAGAFFPDDTWVGPMMYFISVGEASHFYKW